MIRSWPLTKHRLRALLWEKIVPNNHNPVISHVYRHKQNTINIMYMSMVTVCDLVWLEGVVEMLTWLVAGQRSLWMLRSYWTVVAGMGYRVRGDSIAANRIILLLDRPIIIPLSLLPSPTRLLSPLSLHLLALLRCVASREHFSTQT